MKSSPKMKTIVIGISGILLVSVVAYAAYAASAPASPSAQAQGATPAAATAQNQDSLKRAQGGTGASASGASATAGATSVGDLTDAEIVGWVDALDSNEITAANAAEKKKIAKEYMTYAKMLDKQHRANQKKTAKLAKQLKLTPAQSAASTQLKAMGTQDMTAMAALEGAQFERAYVDAMVKGHTEALAALDGSLITGADDAKLKKHLTELREHVSMHLEQGKRLQGASASRKVD
ncbi:MAG: putative outer membrane protein [Fibrobacteres bacterium]|nr:putative outer membrane protein [Fibrobacterota bacterium]